MRRSIPRFALYELIRKGDRLVDARLYVWGLDLSDHRYPEEGCSGAMFISPQGTWGNADSAEATFQIFSLIRDVRLVWL